jgi:hypothetical protein
MSRAWPPACGQAIGGGGRDGVPGKVERFPPPPIDFAWLFQIPCNFPTSLCPRRHAHFQLRLLRTETHDHANSPGHEPLRSKDNCSSAMLAVQTSLFVSDGAGILGRQS